MSRFSFPEFLSSFFSLHVAFLFAKPRCRHMIWGVSKRPRSQRRFASAPPAVIQGLGPDVPELQQARALWMANRFDESLRLFDRAVQRCPQNLVALIDASRAFGTRFEIPRAEELLDRLIRLAPQRADILHLAGQSYRMIFRPDKALECFERVLALTRQIPDASLELAVLFERRHRLTEALSIIGELLAKEPDFVEAQLMEARLRSRLGETGKAEESFRRIAKTQSAHAWVRAQAWTELAQLLDRAGGFDEAMQAMLAGKQLLLAHEAKAKRDSDLVLEHLRLLAQSVTPEHWRRWLEAARDLPPVRAAHLLGFPRSGTTLLEQVLDAHPEVISSEERETFGRDIFPGMFANGLQARPTAQELDGLGPERLVELRQRYFNFMEAALDQPIAGRVHLDKNPSQTLLLPGLLRLLPESRVFMALRDPRDVVVSCFMQYMPLNTNSVCYLTLERAAARYALDMGAWLKWREALPTIWLQVRYEDTVRDLEGEARRALAFLGLPWHEQVLRYRERLRQKPVSSPTYADVSQPVYTKAVGRWRHYLKHLEPCLPVLQPFLEAFGYG